MLLARSPSISYVIDFRQAPPSIDSCLAGLQRQKARCRQRKHVLRSDREHRRSCSNLILSMLKQALRQAGVKDMRFQAFMPDILHWLGVKKVRYDSYSLERADLEYDAQIDYMYSMSGEYSSRSWLLPSTIDEYLLLRHEARCYRRLWHPNFEPSRHSRRAHPS